MSFNTNFNRHKWFAAFGLITLIVSALVLAREPILFSLGSFLIVKEANLRPAELIHVLGGGSDRITYGVELYKQGYSRQLFFTGDGPVTWSSVTYPSDAEFAKAYALAEGVPQEAIVPFESLTMSTYDEALELKRLLQTKESIRSVIIVSDPYHMRRVRWAFKQVLGHQLTVQFSPVPFVTARNKERWWTHESSRKMVSNEYLKILYYHIRYQFPACSTCACNFWIEKSGEDGSLCAQWPSSPY